MEEFLLLLFLMKINKLIYVLVVSFNLIWILDILLTYLGIKYLGIDYELNNFVKNLFINNLVYLWIFLKILSSFVITFLFIKINNFINLLDNNALRVMLLCVLVISNALIFPILNWIPYLMPLVR